MPKEAHSVIRDTDGDRVEVWANGGQVYLWIPAEGARFGPEQQEAMGQAFIAACNAADRQGSASHG